MRTMVLVYLPTKLGDFGQGQMLETLPAPWVMAHLHYCHFHIAIGSIIGEFSWKVIMFAPEMRRVSLSLSPPRLVCKNMNQIRRYVITHTQQRWTLILYTSLMSRIPGIYDTYNIIYLYYICIFMYSYIYILVMYSTYYGIS